MDITEKDIFDFVYFRENLSKEKQDFIVQNQPKFSSLLDFYSELEKSFDEDLDPASGKAFEKLFPSEQPVIKLYPVEVQVEEKRKLRFAAASLTGSGSIGAVSFIDKDQTYLVRALSSNDKTELFVFASDNSSLQNFSLVTKPSGRQYLFENNSNSLVTPEKEIQEINLILNQ